VSQDEYATWLAGAKKKFAATSTPAVHLADNDAVPAR
jgi:hypothetical protein